MRSARAPARVTPQPGFTLIELMVVIVVLGVLMGIAVPSYFEQVKRARRADAREALSDLATRQEQFFLDNKAYSNSIADLGRGTGSVNDYYAITIPVFTTTTYTLQAAAIGTQLKDTDCPALTLDQAGVRSPLTCWR